jgi:hypothetical protein
MLRRVTQSAGGDIAAGWALIVLHRIDCGITCLCDSASFFRVADTALSAKAIEHPRAAAALRHR